MVKGKAARQLDSLIYYVNIKLLHVVVSCDPRNIIATFLLLDKQYCDGKCYKSTIYSKYLFPQMVRFIDCDCLPFNRNQSKQRNIKFNSYTLR